MASGSSPGTSPSAAEAATTGTANRRGSSPLETIGSIAERIAGRFGLKWASAAGALAVAVPLGLIWVIAEPTVSDMAAQASRVGIFERQGWGIWSGQWYAGHHLPGYSLLMPPFGALVGIWWAGFIAVCSASVTTALVGSRAARTPRQAALIGSLLGLGCVASLCSGRTTWLLGLAIAGLAVDLLIDRRKLALLPAVIVAGASPLGAVMIAAGAAVCWLLRRDALSVAVGILALLPGVVISIVFPTGGSQPFPAWEFGPITVATVLLFRLSPKDAKGLRTTVGIYLLMLIGAFILATPVGSNAERPGQLAGTAAVAAAVIAGGNRRWLAWVFVALLTLQWVPPIQDLVRQWDQRSTEAAFYRPLIEQVQSRDSGAPPGRLEIVWTMNHWEDEFVAAKIPLARGWERQLDRRFNSSVNGDHVSPEAFRSWIDGLGVRWVAYPWAPLDRAIGGESRLVRRGLPWLEQVWRSPDWVLYRVKDPSPLADGPVTVTKLEPRAVQFSSSGPGTSTVKVRWSRWWGLRGIKGCLAPGPNGMTELRTRQAGAGKLEIGLTGSGPHC